MKEAIKTRKEKADKRWLLLDESMRVSLSGPYRSDEELMLAPLKEVTSETRSILRGMRVVCQGPGISINNTINRLTGTTGEGMFAPYITENTYFFPKQSLPSMYYWILKQRASKRSKRFSAR